MRPVRVVAPFVFIPALFGCDYFSKVNNPAPQLGEVVPNSPKSLSDLFNEAVEDVEFPLTEEDKIMLDEIGSFLTTYTGNGKFNYGTIPRLLEGLKQDYGLAWILASRIAPTKIVNELEGFGVDIKTEDTPDNAPINNYVTKAELDKFRENTYKLETRGEKLLEKISDPKLKDKRIIFPEGISVEAIRHIREGSLKLPPGAILVDKVSEVNASEDLD